MSLVWIILLPLLVGTLATPAAARASRNAAAWTAAAVTAGSLAIVASLAPQVFAGAPVAARWQWLPALGLDVSFRLDGLALLFAILILVIGLLVILYARYYLADADPIGKLYALLMLFMAAMLGIVLSDNLLLLVIFWELTSVSSFLLVGYWSEKAEARQGARMALTVTGGGGLAMLAGFLVLGHIAGSFEISTLDLRGQEIHAHPLYPLALGLILVGAFTKSAQFPFHFWLPEAMAAPTPVSAYLHSATMVKAGVFLLMRLYPALGDTALFEYTVAGTGLATMVFAAYVAVFKHDLKGLLAYSTISHLGLIVFLIGLDSPLSSVAAVFHVVNHATFKAALFMSAGIIDHETGTRDMRRINGLWKSMPRTATLAILASGAMAGVPLLNGFLSKEMFFAEAIDLRHLGWFGTAIPFIAVAGATFSVAYSARFIHDVFFNGEPRNLPRTPHEPPALMRVPVELLVVVVILVGVLPGLTVGPIVNLAAEAVSGARLPDYQIAIWHGFNMPLLMSAIALAAGAAMYWALQRQYRLHLHVPAGFTARLLFQKFTARLFSVAGHLTAKLENRSLQRYAALTIAAALVAGALPFLGTPLSAGPLPTTPASGVAYATWLILVAAAVAAVLAQRRRVLVLVFVATCGLVVSLVFIMFSAPDLALTQLSVEVVSTVLMLMALALLPQRAVRDSSRARRGRDAMLGVAAGGGVAALAYAAMTRPLDTISWYFLENTVARGGGTNTVNVILVDFRGYDTFGEITVLGIAAVGVLALMEGMRVRREPADDMGRPWATGRYALLIGFAARVLLPFALVVSLYIFLRGHNQPGGGFIAGLVTAVALVMQYMAGGREQTESRLRVDYVRVIGAGIGIAGLTGLAAWLFAKPFLTSAHGHPHVPLLGEIPLASAAVFDLGVYLTVVGATLLTLSALGTATRPPTELATEAQRTAENPG